MIFNQFLLNSYAANDKKLYEFDSVEKISNEKNNEEYKILLSEKINNEYQITPQEKQQIEKFKKQILKINNINDFQEQIKGTPANNNSVNSNKDYIQKGKDNKNLSNQNKKNKQIIIERKDLNKSPLNSLPLPAKSKIFSSQFEVPSRGYVNLKGPKISLNLNGADALETLKLLGELGNYGIVIIEDNASSNKSQITANFDEEDISDVFNSILLSSKLEAVVERNIIFIGKDILNKSINPKVSKTYRLNQVNAASVADYLSTLGANISKVMLVSGSIDGAEIDDGFVNKKEFKDELKDSSYGIEGGPLYGLIGTADLRLQTITLIGTKDLIKLQKNM